MPHAVYLDHNATSPLRPEAFAAMTEAMRDVGNASSVHGFGRRARKRVEDARGAVARLVGAKTQEVVFTSGGTEANNWALIGASPAKLLVSAVEHDSVLAVPGGEPIAVEGSGRLDLADLERKLRGAPAGTLVSVMLANNETGAIQPIDAVVELARQAGALVHCDAVQGIGKLPVDFAGLGVDMLSISAHKLGGPQGLGALVLREGLGSAPLLRGGGQEGRRRAGTENVAAIAGFGAAAEAAAEGLAAVAGLAEHRDRFEAALLSAVPKARIFAAESPRLANTSCVAMPGVGAETQVMAFDLAGVAVSSGSACSSGKVAPSHVLAAMGVPPDLAASALRVSLGWNSAPDALDRCLEVWLDLHRRHRERRRIA